MSLRATVHPVQLDPNSLYISTIPLLATAFHWALIHVDQHGVATRHQWAATTPDPQGPEAYVEHAMPHGPMSKVEKEHILAYFKISRYNPVDVADLRRVCASVFPSSYLTAQGNRRGGITARAWITRILSELLGPDRAQEIVEQVKKHSTTCSNTFATDFLFQRPYEIQLYTL